MHDRYWLDIGSFYETGKLLVHSLTSGYFRFAASKYQLSGIVPGMICLDTQVIIALVTKPLQKKEIPEWELNGFWIGDKCNANRT